MRRHTLRLRGIVVALAVALVVCFTPRTLVHAQNGATTVSFPFTQTSPNPCTAESVFFSGTTRITTNTIVDSSGGVRVILLTNVKADGIGLPSGITYRGNQSQEDTFNGGPGSEFTSELQLLFVSRGSADNLILSVLVHTTVNANGDTTSTVSNIRLDCKG